MSAPSIQKKATEKTRVDALESALGHHAAAVVEEGCPVSLPITPASIDNFPADFRDYMGRELKYSRLDLGDGDIGWVFWNRQDDHPNLTLSNDHSVDAPPDDVYASLKVRQKITLALHKLLLIRHLDNCLVQFWAPTKTKDGRTLLTTQNQPFALGHFYYTRSRNSLCEYRMGMCREYNSFYADAESGEEQLGLPGRVFRNQFPESTPHVKYYSLKEYPQRDLALHCGIETSWGLPVFEHSSHTCVGVLEIVDLTIAESYFEKFLDWANDIFQEVGLGSFDGYKHCEMQELKMVYESVCETHNIPLVLTWVSCRSTNDLLESQFQFINEGYRDENDDDYRDENDDDYDDDYGVYSLYWKLRGFAEISKFCHLRKGQVSGRILPFPNLLYCSDVKQFSIAEYPLVPNARFCKFGGWFTMCLQSSHTGDELYMIEFFLPASKKNDENILSRLRLILATMEEYFITFKLASGQEWGEVLSVEVIDFRNDQRCHSIQMIPATRGGLMLQQSRQDQPSMEAINNQMFVVSEEQNHIFPSRDSLQNGEVTTPLDSSNQPSMDLSNNVQNVVIPERNIPVVSSSKEGKRKMQDREHKKGGPRIEIPLEEILKCSNMSLKDAVAEFNVGRTTFKSICRAHGIDRWPPSNVKKARPSLQLPVENKGQTPQLNSDLPSNEASGSVANIKTGFQDADKVAVKAKYGDMFIRFYLSLPSKFVELQQEVAESMNERLNLSAGTYDIKYKDEDEELISIERDKDLQYCIQYFRSLGKTTIVLQLEPKETITPS